MGRRSETVMRITVFVVALALCALGGLAVLPVSAPSWKPPAYTVYRAGSPLSIDGKLDEPAWFAAPDDGEFRFPWWKPGNKESTVATLLWDDENLYTGRFTPFWRTAE